MRLTKLGHSCVRLQRGARTLVIDPGSFTGPGALDGADSVLITHEHADHLDGAGLRAAMSARAGLEVWTNGSVARELADLGPRVHVVAHGDSFAAAGFHVRVYGRDHAVIHPDIPVVANIGFAVEETVFHPGDAFTVPDEPVPVLLLPVSAPWLKASEMIDYARTVAPARGYAIHDAILSENGIGLIRGLLSLARGTGAGEFSVLEPGTSVEL
jgi:L-ascorbate metabolism protein UlaG (beta-lactamase superfamily)